MNEADYLISTPENVDLHLEFAGIGNRVLAAALDAVLLMAILLLLGLFLFFAAMLVDYFPVAKFLKTIIMLYLAGIGTLFAFAIVVGYHIYFEGQWQGQTPGKKLTGIRVVELNGQPITWAAAFIRNLLRIVDVGFSFVGLLIILATPQERRLGDLAAGTIVIRERPANWLSQAVTISPGIVGSAPIDVGHIQPQDYELLVNFLSRREAFQADKRSQLARELEGYMRLKVNDQAVGDSSEKFLERVYESYQQRAQATI